MRPRSFLSVIAFLFAGVSACTAQAPANDAFANRQIITGAFPQTVGGTTVSATAEGQEPGHADFFGGNVASNSVWFRWTSTFDGYLSVEVTGAAFDTAVAIYTGSALNSLVEIDSADRYILANERAIAEVQGGVIYSVAVDGFSTSAGTAGESGPFELVLSQFSTPSNDDFASAEVLTSVFGAEAVEGHTVAATAEAGEPDHANLIVSGGNLASNSVWYRWTAPVDGFVGANVESTFDASIGVYTGTALANLVEIGASDFYESQAPERWNFLPRGLRGSRQR